MPSDGIVVGSNPAERTKAFVEPKESVLRSEPIVRARQLVADALHAYAKSIRVHNA